MSRGNRGDMSKANKGDMSVSRMITIERTGNQLEIIEADSSDEPASIEEIEVSHNGNVVDKIPYTEYNFLINLVLKLLIKIFYHCVQLKVAKTRSSHFNIKTMRMNKINIHILTAKSVSLIKHPKMDTAKIAF